VIGEQDGGNGGEGNRMVGIEERGTGWWEWRRGEQDGGNAHLVVARQAGHGSGSSVTFHWWKVLGIRVTIAPNLSHLYRLKRHSRSHVIGGRPQSVIEGGIN